MVDRRSPGDRDSEAEMGDKVTRYDCDRPMRQLISNRYVPLETIPVRIQDFVDASNV
jgi:hypothetical protein